MKKVLYFLVFGLIIWFAPMVGLYAQGEYGADFGLEYKPEIIKGEVVQILDEREEVLEGMGITTLVQSLHVKLLDGSKAGDIVQIYNDYIHVEKGDKIFISHTYTYEGEDYFL